MFKAIAHFVASRRGVLAALMRPRTSRPAMHYHEPRGTWSPLGSGGKAEADDPFSRHLEAPLRRGRSDDDILFDDSPDWRSHT